MGLHPRLRIDISRRDLVAALGAALLARDRSALARRLEEQWAPDGQGFACMSVRSGFDLLLSELDLPQESEALLSAVNIPDMAQVLEAHGVRPVPVDLDPETLAPTAGGLRDALSSRTRLVLVAHLFGGRVDLSPIAAFAAEHDLLLIEDAAQAFRGSQDRGDARADVSMFSFGPVKTATALGGALLRVADPALREGMRRRQSSWPVQPRAAHARRALLFLGLSFVRGPRAYGALAWGSARAGKDLDAVLSTLIQPFADPPEPGRALDRDPAPPPFFVDIRRQPCAPLLALLARRLRGFDRRRLSRRTAAGELVRRELPLGLALPGAGARERTHWLVPVVGPEPGRLVSSLRAAGFDGARAATSIVALAASGTDSRPRRAQEIMEQIVFLPAYPEVGEKELRRLLAVLRRFTLGDGAQGGRRGSRPARAPRPTHAIRASI